MGAVLLLIWRNKRGCDSLLRKLLLVVVRGKFWWWRLRLNTSVIQCPGYRRRRSLGLKWRHIHYLHIASCEVLTLFLFMFSTMLHLHSILLNAIVGNCVVVQSLRHNSAVTVCYFCHCFSYDGLKSASLMMMTATDSCCVLFVKVFN